MAISESILIPLIMVEKVRSVDSPIRFVYIVGDAAAIKMLRICSLIAFSMHPNPLNCAEEI